MKLLVKKCCCCVELTTGTMMLGWASLVFALSSILLCILGIIYADEAANHFHEEMLLNHKYEADAIRMAIEIMCSVIIFGKLINMVSAGLLLAGTVKRNPLLLVPWLFAEFCTTIILVVFGIIEFVQDVERDNHYVLNAFLNLIYLGVSIYFWICIYSFYKSLREEEANFRQTVEPPPYLTPRFEKDGDLPYVTLT